MSMSPEVQAAYDLLYEQSISHDTENAREIAAILLNSYNYNMANIGFNVGRFRHFDRRTRESVILYLGWLGSEPGLYPPSLDIDKLKNVWSARDWR